jgi:hypothetical protein
MVSALRNGAAKVEMMFVDSKANEKNETPRDLDDSEIPCNCGTKEHPNRGDRTINVDYCLSRIESGCFSRSGCELYRSRSG